MADQVAAPGPQTSVDPRVQSRLSTTGRFIRWLAVLYAGLTLLGPIFPSLQRIPPGPSLLRAIPSASAVSLFVLALGALLAGDVGKNVGTAPIWRRSGVALSLGSAVFGAFILYVFFSDMTEIWGEDLAIPAASVGVILMVLGVAVPLSVSRIEWRVLSGQVAALLVFSVTAVIFLGYAYGDPSVGRFFLRPAISFQASIVSFLCAIGIVLLRPASGLLSRASSPGSGGRVLRWFGPVVLFTPAIVLLITEAVPTSERVDVLAFVSVGLGLFLLIMLGFFVRALDETAMEATTMAAHAERAMTGLEQEAPVVSEMADLFHIVEIDPVDGWEVATRFRPGRGAVAGDASGVLALPDGGIGAVLVDLTGHGADPAVWAIRIRDLLLQSLVAGKTASEAMALTEWSVPRDVLASAMVMEIDPTEGRVVLCSAGHPPAILIGSEEASLKSPTGPLLYLEHSTLYEVHEFEMARGDTLVAFSDGVADIQLTRQGRTEPELLADVLLAEPSAAARSADLVLGFGDPEPTDDQTVVVIRRSL